MKNGILSEFEDRENSSEHSGDSGSNSAGDHKMATVNSSSTKKRKALQKKVVSIPIKDLESSSRNKGEAAPPSDSWAWRKYGQKPIKGSPYPRGYYRCSSSKGCPARKQVERNRVDPTMLVVTYSSDHNHPWPLSSRNHNDHSPTHRHSPPLSAAVYDNVVDNATPSKSESPDEVEPKQNTADEKENDRFATINVAAVDDLYGWFADMGCAAMLDSPLLAETSSNDTDISMLFPIMGEEDEYLFADLGELPECSTVFRQRDVAADACGTQWCGATS